MTAAVRGWSPVIIMTRMPACHARTTASFASGTRRIDDAYQPCEREVVLETFVGMRGLFRKRVAREPPAGDTERSQRLAREGFVGLQDAFSPLVGDRPAIFADEFARASRQQHVRRTLGKHNAVALLLGIAMDRAHQLPL